MIDKVTTKRSKQLKGAYLGQSSPGMKPRLFALGIISTNDFEGCSGWGNEIEFLTIPIASIPE